MLSLVRICHPRRVASGSEPSPYKRSNGGSSRLSLQQQPRHLFYSFIRCPTTLFAPVCVRATHARHSQCERSKTRKRHAMSYRRCVTRLIELAQKKAKQPPPRCSTFALRLFRAAIRKPENSLPRRSAVLLAVHINAHVHSTTRYQGIAML